MTTQPTARAASTDAPSGISSDAPAWSGRHDGDGPEHARWHQAIRQTGDLGSGAADSGTGTADSGSGAAADHVAVLGFSSDEGVRRNRGRTGAAEGPTALRRALSPLALHGRLAAGEVGLVDHGDTATVGEDLEGGQAAASAAISAALDAPGCRLAVVLGGGHETAWASYGGLLGASRMAADDQGRVPRWGVLNLDAHFDLRREERPTSGTPFLQIAEAEASAGRPLAYAVVGISEPSNTGALFATARELGVRWMTDLECAQAGAAGIAGFVEDFARELDVLYLTIDLDLLPASVAPGVSAPAGLGVAPALVTAAVRAAAGTGKLVLADVVELNPSFDIDARTARTAARLIDEAVSTAVARF